MYEHYLNLNSRPFFSTPYVEHYVPSQSTQKALTSARIAIDRGAGPVLIVGESGTGKSLLLAMIEQEYLERFRVVNLSCARLEKRQDFLQAILFELQLPYLGLSEGELRLSLLEYLRCKSTHHNGLLLLVDDGDHLSIEVLDELRLVSSFSQAGQPRARLVIVGSVRLEELIGDSRLQSLNQRVAARCYLSNLNFTEVSEYISEHIHRVGGDANRIFDSSCFQKIHELTEGCPRVINQLCDHVLILCMTHGRVSVDDAILGEAWSDLQCFPDVFCTTRSSNSFASPCRGERGEFTSAENWSVVEFGSLDDLIEQDSEERIAQDQPAATCQGSEQAMRELASKTNIFPVNLNSDQEASSSETQAASFWSSDLPVPASYDPYESQIDWDGPSPVPLDVEFKNQDRDSIETCDSPFIDIQRVPEIVKPVAANPFVEPFEAVEVVQHRNAPTIAQCNRASQDVSSDDLQFLNHLSQITQHNSEGCNESGHPVSDPQVEARQSWRGSDHSDIDHSSDSLTGSLKEFDVACPLFETHELQVTKETTAAADHESDATLQTVYRSRTEEMEQLDSLRPVSHHTAWQSPACQSLPCTLSMSGDSDPQPAIAFAAPGKMSSDDPELNEMESLKQVIEEQNRFSAQAFSRIVVQTNAQAETNGWRIAPATAQINVSSSAEQIQQTSERYSAQLDDRDMLVCEPGEAADLELLSNRASERIPFPPTPVSTGRAERMDYQQLFNQLRNLPDI